MGGFLKASENLDQAATCVLHSLTDLNDIYMEQLNTFSKLIEIQWKEPFPLPTMHLSILKNIIRNSFNIIMPNGLNWMRLHN